MPNQSEWIVVAFGAFVGGLLMGAFLAGVVLSKLLDVLIDGISLELADDIERRFKMELLNSEWDANPQRLESIQPPFGNAATVSE